MRRAILLFAVLALCRPMVVEGQSIQYKGAGISGLSSSGTAVTSTVPLLLPDGSAAAPSLSFSSGTNVGFYSSGGNIYWGLAGIARGLLSGGSLSLLQDTGFYSIGVSGDVKLYRDAANTLALRNAGTAATPVPQTFNVYNFCDGAACATGYERGYIKWSTNVLTIGSEVAGTGSARATTITSGTAINITPGSGESISNGLLRPGSNDAFDLGTSVPRAWRILYLTQGIQGAKTKALTEGAATTVATVGVPQTAGSNFAAGEVRYTVYASDGTDTQVLNGSAFFSALNKAGTETCQITDDQIGTEASSSGTLVCTLACATGLTDVVGITFDCTSSLTQTSLNALVRFDMQQSNTLAFP